MTPRNVLTNDGSATLYSDRYRQHYHNIAGALTESRHVFFERTGLFEALKSHRDITICETGFGSGFHLILMEWLRHLTGSRSTVFYYSVEKHPVPPDQIRGMGFEKLFPGVSGKGDDEAAEGPAGEASPIAGRVPSPPLTPNSLGRLADLAEALYAADSGATVSSTMTGQGGQTFAHIYRGDFFDWDLSQIHQPAHFFLHDAFSPDANPELWTKEAFSKLLQAADSRAMLGTYCSATRARAAMVLAGWHVARAAGPPGKREMTLASSDEAMLEGYKPVNAERLRERFGT
ncbi:MnmC family methyltransferase [Balneolales bacterium ANBcel1]|nr:MnmC family methyltransferase [Balneolales bacterium ANBcel1]